MTQSIKDENAKKLLPMSSDEKTGVVGGSSVHKADKSCGTYSSISGSVEKPRIELLTTLGKPGPLWLECHPDDDCDPKYPDMCDPCFRPCRPQVE